MKWTESHQINKTLPDEHIVTFVFL